ncbi:hypothetical protein SAMN02910369_02593 [Lachnospiraceae bacterium NE2001]|nr:hypothetical protein SAMN02910369_02593 [Lachnospiraceae bacterium NE2001]
MSEETVKNRLSRLKESDEETDNLKDAKADQTTDVLSKTANEASDVEEIVMDDVPEEAKAAAAKKAEEARQAEEARLAAAKAKKAAEARKAASGDNSGTKTTNVVKSTSSSKASASKKPISEYPAFIQFIWKYKTIICGIAIFLIYVLVQMKYVYEVWFDPDELDIYTVAYEMFKGKILYRDIASQHMPWTYIISWIFFILGAHSAFLQRVYFYILFAGFWTSFIFIYKKYVNKWALVIHPFIYLAVIQHIDFATQILSEHLQVIGFQIFLLEFLMFLKKRDLSLGSCIRMSIAVLFTFGTAFLSVYPLFFMFLGVVALEIKWGLEEGTPMKDWWIMIGKKYGRLVGVVAVPWVIMVIAMLCTKSFHDFGFGAYTINVLYYPNYMAGLGGSSFSNFLVPITEVVKYYQDFAFDQVGIVFMIRTILVICGIYLGYRIAKDESKIAGFAVYMFTFLCGVRGFYNFHGTPFVGIMSMVVAIVMTTYMVGDKKSFDAKPVLTKAALAFMSFIIVLNFSTDIQMIPNFLFVAGESNYYQTDTDIVMAITDEDERIWQTNICNSVPWASGRVTTGPTVSCPWMWDAIGSHKIEDFKNDPARVIMFQIGYESWGHKMADYAPEAYYFIINNYKYIPTSTMIWVRSDYYEEACAKLGIDPDMENDYGYSCTPFNPDETEFPGKTYEDRVKYLEEQAKAAEAGTNAEDADSDDSKESEEEEQTTEEKTTEATTEEVTTEESNDTKDDDLAGPIIDETSNPMDDDNSTGPGGTSATGSSTSTTGPSSSSSGNGPGDVTVSPADENGTSSSVTSDTPGAIQAPDGSWVVPDDSTGPGQ